MTDQKMFIVTGAAGNVGAALTTLLTARGHRVAAMDRTAESLAAHFGANALVVPVPVADLSDPAVAQAAVAQAGAALGNIDGVAATVGTFAMAPTAESAPDLWERMLRINLYTVLNTFSAALPHLRAAGSGSLVAISAGAALRAGPGMAAYAASKSAVLRLVESMADEVKGERIRVNAVLPGTIDTPQNRAAMPDADPSRWVTPTQVAEVLAFLLSEASAGVTGAALGVPGLG
jgi:NAD(P)-dependent dehydrogenase (short-subunit alcohol dehydrogenase family)